MNMNFNTIKQELNKKTKKMSEDDFNNFISELKRIYYKDHNNGSRKEIKDEWLYSRFLWEIIF